MPIIVILYIVVNFECNFTCSNSNMHANNSRSSIEHQSDNDGGDDDLIYN